MRALALSLALIVLAVPARAADNVAVAKLLGEARLLGSWAVDCAASPDPSSPWEVLAVGDDGVVRSTNDGGEWRAIYRITAARRTADNDITMTVQSEQLNDIGVTNLGAPIEVVYRLDGDRQKTWSSVNSAGEKLVTGGLFQDGSENPWYQRCGSLDAA